MKMMKRMKWFTILSCIILIAVVGGTIAINFFSEVKAATIQYGTVNADTVNVRSGPGTTYGVLTTAAGTKVQLSEGSSVVVEGTAKATDGTTWYKLSFIYDDGKEYTGYMSGKYVNLYKVDAEFDAYLDEQGFPDSYKEGLQALHSLYPNWIFEADHLNYTWDEAVDGQMVLGRNLVSISDISAYKSTAPGAYDWETGKWTTFDGGSWNAASEAIVSYCMDPRNFLNATQIFQFELLSYDSEVHTSSGVQNVIDGSFMESAKITNTAGKSVTYNQTLMDAAASSGVSPYHLAARIIQEMGTNGSSKSISGTVSGYAGYYNYYNIGAYAANGNSAIVNGLIYAKGGSNGTLTTYGRPWNTRYKGVVGGASYIGSGYINIGQDTLYYEKFDYVGSPFTHQYMTYVIAPQSEAKKMAAAYSEEMRKETAFTFKIPVFKDMPTAPAAKPADNTSPNNYLASLAVTGQTLSPSFSGATTEYSLIVGEGVTSVTVTAKTADSKASISGTGTHTLKVGENTITVAVTAENGDLRVYRIIVIREGEENEPPTTQPPTTQPPTTTQSKPIVTMTYTVFDMSYVRGFTVGDTISNVLKNIKVTNGSAKITDVNGTAKGNTSIITTGDRLVINDSTGSVYSTYHIVLYGDINGDGKLDIKDLLKYKNTILGKIELSKLYTTAGDTSRDGKITVVELLKMKNQILGKELISQK
ncbi:MAG: mannosyl-glycoprotein endo-beta-N-acetylglucosamidase [Lachnospiraceae bacterium]|nr:mannosyl-glycoprotein endo-beta-N-acetylglucosamidase [Lachnospiraceae bacterium]